MPLLSSAHAPALFYEDQGSGPPVLLLHGWSRSGADFEALSERLAERHRVIRPDLRGHGRSAPGPFTLDRLAGDLVALAEALDLRSALLVGWSLGAQVALAALPRLGGRAGRLVLVGATPHFTSSTDWPHGPPPRALEGMAALFRRRPEAVLARFLDDCFAPGELEEPRRAALARPGAARPPDAGCALAGLDLLATSDLRGDLPGVTRPVLLLHGEADAICPVTAARAMATLLPSARLHAFPGAGHAPFVSRPAEVAALLEAFAAEAA
jgi:pimeloyl-ACP methyl ester esterase